MLQMRLQELGFLDSSIDVYGYYGAKTQNAVNAYKDKYMPSGNTGENRGVIGETTWERLGLVFLDDDEYLIYQSYKRRGLASNGTDTAEDLASHKHTSDYFEDLSCKFEKTIEVADKENGDEKLLKQFKSMAKLLSMGEMQDVVLDMIDHFAEGSGTPYENEVLTNYAKNHKSTKGYISDMKQIVINELNRNGGNVAALYDESLDKDSDFAKAIENTKRPKFNSKVFDTFINGLRIAINDTWGVSVTISDYKVEGNKFSGTLNFKFYDHFGLDENDMSPEKGFVNRTGFRAWYVLQHYNKIDNSKYNPFITEFNISEGFEGELK